jgi:hypothetical protein
MTSVKVLTVLSLATLFASAFGQSENPARPGTLNYVEGSVALGGRAVNQRSIGTIAMDAGQTLSTANGHAEVLLTPGVFLRLDHDTTVKMVEPNLTQTEVEVDRGRAEVEVDALYKQNDLLIDDKTTQTKILNRGLYEFDANAGELKVFDGKAAVSPAQNAAKWVDVKGSHEFALNGESGKPQHFDKDASQDELYNWSSLRADYLGQANQSLLAGGYAGEAGVYPGWAWDPAFYGYTWLPYDGLLYSPFGFGFYSPGFFYGGGFGYRGGYGFRSGYGFHGGYAGGLADRSAGFAGGGGFHSGGGFHGGGGRR